MKPIYILTHTHQVKDIVATFTDYKKAEEAFDIFYDYIKSNYGLFNVEQELCYERKEKGYCSFRNGHILRIEESRIFTDISSFKKIL